MTEHQRETAFLRRLIHLDRTEERRKLDGRIAQLQRDERSVQRAAGLMVLFITLGLAGLAYGTVLQENFFYGGTHLVMEMIFAVGIASLVCLIVFIGLLMVYRRRLNRLREECRRLVAKLLQSHLPESHVTPVVAPDNRDAAQGAVAGNGSPARSNSLRTSVDQLPVRK